jgi:SsrA-binding protein
MAKKKKKDDARTNTSRVRIRNRKAWHDYHIELKVECGIVLLGTEVKSIRAGQAKLDESYARIHDGEVFLIGCHIAPYKQAAEGMQHATDRKRKLLLHKRQIAELRSHTQQKGKTIVPLEMFFKRGVVKVELGVAVGKTVYDKRETIKRKQHQREIDREVRKHAR